MTRDIVAQLQELVSRDTISRTHAETLARLAIEPSVLKDAIPKAVIERRG